MTMKVSGPAAQKARAEASEPSEPSCGLRGFEVTAIGVAMEREIRTQEARQGRTPGIVRYVLGISLGLAVLAMVIVYLVFF
jgi:hypothetical protein